MKNRPKFRRDSSDQPRECAHDVSKISGQTGIADGRGSLWVVDAAAPNTEKTIKNGPKLVQIDLKTNSVKRIYPFGADIAGPASYLNDVRISPDGRFDYITDSGSPGGLVVTDLNSGKAWRALSDDPSTQAENDVTVRLTGTTNPVPVTLTIGGDSAASATSSRPKSTAKNPAHGAEK